MKTVIEKEEEQEEENEDYSALNINQNRKHKKAGGWQAMGFDHAVYKGIIKKGYRQPTPIQRKAIPLICASRDVVAMSRTGSGKTAAFVLPMLQKLKKRDTRGIRAIILSPTRELALQTFKIVKELGRYTGLFCTCLIGGDNMEEQFAVLHQHPDILLATPGRLLHIAVEMNLKLNFVQYLVFDEADRLFEMGFADQIKEILKRLPESRQTLLFSATLPKILVDFAKAGLSDPELVRLDVESRLSGKLSMVFALCRQNEKLPVLLNLCRMLSQQRKKTIVFCATMKHVEFIVAVLREATLDPAFLYSQLDPIARKQNITRFRTEESCTLLVVTDIAARGMDIPLLDFAINMHFPPKPKLFVHRVGRVARAGKSGTSISFIASDEMAYFVDLFLFLGRPIQFAEAENINKWKCDEENSALIGTFPQVLSHMEAEFLLTIQQNSIEISDLMKKAENAMKKYQSTRPKPSAESVRRTKFEFRQMNPSTHPFFLDPEFFPEIAPAGGGGIFMEQKILQDIRDWRPNQAIFDIRNSLGGVGTFVGTRNEQKLKEGGNSNKREQQKIEERSKHFVAYQPMDANVENGLAVENNFEKATRSAAIELSADDDKGMYLEAKNKQKIWDRKRKKFVNTDDKGEQVKRVKTEDGRWVPSSYKSGRYEKWKMQQKVDYQQKDEEEERENTTSFQGKRRGRNQNGRNLQNPKKNEVKNVEQIVKTRRKKAQNQAYQDHRRRENLKKKTKDATNHAGKRKNGKRRMK